MFCVRPKEFITSYHTLGVGGRGRERSSSSYVYSLFIIVHVHVITLPRFRTWRRKSVFIKRGVGREKSPLTLCWINNVESRGSKTFNGLLNPNYISRRKQKKNALFSHVCSESRRSVPETDFRFYCSVSHRPVRLSG